MLSTRLPCVSVSLPGAPAFRVSEFRIWGLKNRGAEHGLAYPADLELRGMADKADPRPHRDAGAARSASGICKATAVTSRPAKILSGEDVNTPGSYCPAASPARKLARAIPSAVKGSAASPAHASPPAPKGKISPVRPSPSSLPSVP